MHQHCTWTKTTLLRCYLQIHVSLSKKTPSEMWAQRFVWRARKTSRVASGIGQYFPPRWKAPRGAARCLFCDHVSVLKALPGRSPHIYTGVRAFTKMWIARGHKWRNVWGFTKVGKSENLFLKHRKRGFVRNLSEKGIIAAIRGYKCCCEI